MLAAAGFLTLTVGGCAGSGGGGKGDPGAPTPGPTGTGSEPTPTPPATPVPTPSGPIYLSELYTPDDTPFIAGGECIGFTLVGNTATLGDDITVELGRWTLPVKWIDATHARVGEEATGGVCTWMPLFLTTSGTYSPVVTTLGASYVLDEEIVVVPVDTVDVGRVFEERVWETAAFEKPFDTDVYLVDFDDIIRRYSDIDFFPTGTVPVVPSLQFWDKSHSNHWIADGGMAMTFPKGGPNYILVRDVQGLGGEGVTYDIAFVGDILDGRRPSDDCSGAPYLTHAASYYVEYDELSNDFNPSCPDSIYGNPIEGPLSDAVWKIAVPPHTQLRAGAYDDHVDSVLFLLPVADGCPHAPTVCTAAAGRFNGGSTDTLVYDNVTDVAQEFYLVHDVRSIHWKPAELENPDRKVGAFLLDIELFPH